MGRAHLVEHRALGTRFAGKVLRGKHRDNVAIADRLRVEAQSLGRLNHPNIVKVFDFDITPDGRPFFIMELLQGFTLAQELRLRGELSCAAAIEWTRQLLSALAAAHAHGIVHRDVKLDNLFLHQIDACRRTLKVLDFGIARIMDEVLAGGLQPPQVPTHAGAIVGTPRFLSPEAALGQVVDHRADVYGAGVVLYMCLCGRGPWDDASSHASVFAAQNTRAPEPPSKSAQQRIPEALDCAVLTAMNMDPEQRFQSATAFESALNIIVSQLSLAAAPASSRSTAPPPVSVPRRAVPTPEPTMLLSDGADTRTELPAVSASGRAAEVRAGSKVLAFSTSALISAWLTWLVLSKIFVR